MAILDIKNLYTTFKTDDGLVRAVNGLDVTLEKGEILGIVGESGSGKSVSMLSVMGLIDKPAGNVEADSIKFEGSDLTRLSEEERRKLRGNRMAMIFQDPMTSLNPLLTVGRQLTEVLELHRGMTRKAARKQCAAALGEVGIPSPERRLDQYPHELSGGMRQRVMIAMGILCEPKLLLADEPTTALDVTIQAQILDLMRDLQRDSGTAVVLITHDLGVVAEMADRVAVMYAGRVVEENHVAGLFGDPQHPYTKGLIGSIPILGALTDTLETIPGIVPSLIDLPPGCRFASRCVARLQNELSICLEQEPEMLGVADGHKVRCWLYAESGNDG